MAAGGNGCRVADHYTVGVEEEYHLLDETTFALVAGVDDVLPRAQRALGDDVQPELNQAQIEIGTPVCTTLDEVRTELARLRQSVQRAADDAGHRISAAGTHPFSSWEDQRITDKPAYRKLAARYAHLADSTVINGCHVHVCLPDREEAVLTMNRMRRWLAPLLALSASSPYWRGHDTGYASYRTEVFGRWPTSGLPELFDDEAAYDTLLDQLISTGAIDEPARIYWHVRPSAKFDTLEVRVADVCTSIDDAVLIAGLARALVQRCHRDVLDQVPSDDVRTEVVRMAVWQAARSGMTGELIDLEAMRPAPAASIVDQLLNHVRLTCDDDDWSTLRHLADAVIARGTSAARQRAIYDRTGSHRAVAEWIADETLAAL